jgi:hypothetical protein
MDSDGEYSTFNIAHKAVEEIRNGWWRSQQSLDYTNVNPFVLKKQTSSQLIKT